MSAAEADVPPMRREIQRCRDLGADVFITKLANYDSFASAIRPMVLVFPVRQVPGQARPWPADPSVSNAESDRSRRGKVIRLDVAA